MPINTLFQNERISLMPFTQATGEINYGWSNSPFGQCLIFTKSKILVGVAFKNKWSSDQIEIDMISTWRESKIDFIPTNSNDIAEQIFFNNSKINIAFDGSPLQTKVWRALLDIPKGTTATYTDIACAVGYPNAVRAVASAIGKNPIAWLIPCHRVLQKSGGYGGYRWGLDIKSRMLSFET